MDYVKPQGVVETESSIRQKGGDINVIKVVSDAAAPDRQCVVQSRIHLRKPAFT